MKKLLQMVMFLSLTTGFSQGKIDLESFSYPVLTNYLYYGIGDVERTKDVKELHLNFMDGGRDASYYFDGQGRLLKYISKFSNELIQYHYENDRITHVEKKDNYGSFKKPVVYNPDGKVYSHPSLIGSSGNRVLYYEYDNQGNVAKIWEHSKDNLEPSDLNDIKPSYSFKYDDKNRLIEADYGFSVETYTYNFIYSTVVEVTERSVSTSGNRKPTSNAFKYNDYGLSGSYAMDEKGNWIARDINRKKEIVFRRVVYADGTISEYKLK